MKEFRREIERYCLENDLSVEKVFSAPRTQSNEWVALQYVSLDRPKTELLTIGGPPAPVMLWIRLEENGELCFEQTEYTYRLHEHEAALVWQHRGGDEINVGFTCGANVC